MSTFTYRWCQVQIFIFTHLYLWGHQRLHKFREPPPGVASQVSIFRVCFHSVAAQLNSIPSCFIVEIARPDILTISQKLISAVVGLAPGSVFSHDRVSGTDIRSMPISFRHWLAGTIPTPFSTASVWNSKGGLYTCYLWNKAIHLFIVKTCLHLNKGTLLADVGNSYRVKSLLCWRWTGAPHLWAPLCILC